MKDTTRIQIVKVIIGRSSHTAGFSLTLHQSENISNSNWSSYVSENMARLVVVELAFHLSNPSS